MEESGRSGSDRETAGHQRQSQNPDRCSRKWFSSISIPTGHAVNTEKHQQPLDHRCHHHLRRLAAADGDHKDLPHHNHRLRNRERTSDHKLNKNHPNRNKNNGVLFAWTILGVTHLCYNAQSAPRQSVTNASLQTRKYANYVLRSARLN